MTKPRPKRTRQRAAAKSNPPALTKEARKALEARLGHRFEDADLLDAAMTHPSAVSGRDAVRHSYQRLEFLGDRVLALHMAERLFERRPTEREGDLAPRFNRLVNQQACAAAARHASLGDHVLLGVSEQAAGGADKDGILSDVCEAVLGALYLDGGLKAASRFIEMAWTPVFEGLSSEPKHPKTRLQEWAQDRDLPLPDYEVVSRAGPDHAPVFSVRAQVEGLDPVIRQGGSKSDAEAAAAIALLAQAEAVG